MIEFTKKHEEARNYTEKIIGIMKSDKLFSVYDIRKIAIYYEKAIQELKENMRKT